MKLGLVFISAATSTKSWMTKEWEVITAFENNQDIVLRDPKIRSNLQWHDCGDKPPTPAGARDVRCNGTTCATVCKKGHRSKGSWKSRCKADKTWTRETLSPCITCDPTAAEAVDSSVAVQSIFRKNLPILQYFCGDRTDTLTFNGRDYKNGGAKRNVKCLCQVPAGKKWGKVCKWTFQNNDFSDFESISCTSTQPKNEPKEETEE